MEYALLNKEETTISLQRRTGKLGPRTLVKPENWNPSGTLQTPGPYWDPTKTGKPGPGTLIGPYENRKTVTWDLRKPENRDLRKPKKSNTVP